jgi:dCTP deaminase
MCVKSDKWIITMCEQNKMIEPFERSLVSKNVFSYGVSSYGYDFRLAEEVVRFPDVTKIDAKKVSKEELIQERANEILIRGGEAIIGRSIEYFRIPRDVIGICFGKSSYARLGILVNVTPLEPEWEGHITISIINANRRDITIYSGEGIGQVIFVGAEEICSVSYKDRKGKYQAQKNIEVPKV